MSDDRTDSPMPPPIRRLTEHDVEDYRRIRLASLATSPDSFGSTYEERAALPLAAFADRLAGAIVLGACAPEGIVGLAHLQRASGAKQAHKGIVQGFFVQPAWRNRGVGAALMTALIHAARGYVEQVHLTVVKGNDDAIALYRRFGFTPYGTEPRALKTPTGYVDELLMALIF